MGSRPGHSGVGRVLEGCAPHGGGGFQHPSERVICRGTDVFYQYHAKYHLPFRPGLRRGHAGG